MSVLIDADADIYYFTDDLLSQGLKGGQLAADMLIEKVRDHLVSLGPSFKDATTIPIMVKAYANLSGLSYHLRDIASPKEINQFWIGFSQRSPFIDFVDVGSGKEAADNKIRGTSPTSTLRLAAFLFRPIPTYPVRLRRNANYMYRSPPVQH